jgi:hypothetical protein
MVPYRIVKQCGSRQDSKNNMVLDKIAKQNGSRQESKTTWF